MTPSDVVTCPIKQSRSLVSKKCPWIFSCAGGCVLHRRHRAREGFLGARCPCTRCRGCSLHLLAQPEPGVPWEVQCPWKKIWAGRRCCFNNAGRQQESARRPVPGCLLGREHCGADLVTQPALLACRTKPQTPISVRHPLTRGCSHPCCLPPRLGASPRVPLHLLRRTAPPAPRPGTRGAREAKLQLEAGLPSGTSSPRCRQGIAEVFPLSHIWLEFPLQSLPAHRGGSQSCACPWGPILPGGVLGDVPPAPNSGFSTSQPPQTPQPIPKARRPQPCPSDHPGALGSPRCASPPAGGGHTAPPHLVPPHHPHPTLCPQQPSWAGFSSLPLRCSPTRCHTGTPLRGPGRVRSHSPATRCPQGQQRRRCSHSCCGSRMGCRGPCGNGERIWDI